MNEDLLDAANFAYDHVMKDEVFLDSGLTPEDAERIVYAIITTQFPKCYKLLKQNFIDSILESKKLLMEADNTFSSNEQGRNEIISKLPLSKQFALRSYLNQTDFLNREQAIEMLKESLVHTAYKDYTFLNMLMSDMPKM